MPPNPERQAKRAAMREQFAADPEMKAASEAAGSAVMSQPLRWERNMDTMSPEDFIAQQKAAEPPPPVRPPAPPLSQPPIGPPTVPSTPGIRAGGGMMTGPTHQIAPQMRVQPTGRPPLSETLSPEAQQRLGVKFRQGGSVKPFSFAKGGGSDYGNSYPKKAR